MIDIPKVGRGPAPTAPSTASLNGLNAIPEDILRDASRRLALLTMIGAAFWVVGFLTSEVLAPALGAPGSAAHRTPFVVILIANLILTAAIKYLSHTEKACPRTLLDIGLAYVVLTAFSIGLLDHWVDVEEVRTGERVSWIAVTILIYGSLVPNTPVKTAAAVFLAASMDFAAWGIAELRNVENLPVGSVLLISIPNYLCAGAAVFPSLIMRKLGRQVRKARELGNYQLEEMLGRGGMGEVWRARHRMLARPAAVKLIRPEMLGAADSDSVRMTLHRFEREAQATAALESVHTVELYDFGITEDGVFYYVMELLQGRDLDTLVREFGALPPERVIHILSQACESLAEAHARGLVHRDVKPANIYVCRRALRTDVVKVLDFGLVKSERDALTVDTMETSHNVTTGTPAYMAPEMATGTREVGPATDLYSLGCVGYWLLTGRIVFEADSAMGMVAKHITEAPVPPSAVTEIPVPVMLEQLILECLEKDPGWRPGSAEDMRRRLCACRVESPWTEERAARWWDRHLPDRLDPSASPAAETQELRIGAIRPD